MNLQAKIYQKVWLKPFGILIWNTSLHKLKIIAAQMRVI